MSMRITSQYHPQALTFSRVKEPNFVRDLGVKLGLCQPTEEASLNQEVFCQRYCEEVARLLPSATAPTCVEQAFQAALAGLPPLQAAALAGQVAQAMVSPEQELQAAEALRNPTHSGLTRQIEEGCQQAGLPLPSKVWVFQSDEMDACASFGGVAVASSHLQPECRPRLHFVVGHEMSHARNRDDIAMMGFEALSQAVQQPLLGYALKQDLRELYHQMELRSDQDGWAYAKAQQVDPRQLQYQVAELLDQQQGSDTHPSGRERLQALRRA